MTEPTYPDSGCVRTVEIDDDPPEPRLPNGTPVRILEHQHKGYRAEVDFVAVGIFYHLRLTHAPDGSRIKYENQIPVGPYVRGELKPL